MTRFGILMLLAMLFVYLAGCGDSNEECGNSEAKQNQQKCAHEAFTERRISPTVNPKKW